MSTLRMFSFTLFLGEFCRKAGEGVSFIRSRTVTVPELVLRLFFFYHWAVPFFLLPIHLSARLTDKLDYRLGMRRRKRHSSTSCAPRRTRSVSVSTFYYLFSE